MILAFFQYFIGKIPENVFVLSLPRLRKFTESIRPRFAEKYQNQRQASTENRMKLKILLCYISSS